MYGGSSFIAGCNLVYDWNVDCAIDILRIHKLLK